MSKLAVLPVFCRDKFIGFIGLTIGILWKIQAVLRLFISGNVKAIVLLIVITVRYGIAKCIWEIVSNKGEV